MYKSWGSPWGNPRDIDKAPTQSGMCDEKHFGNPHFQKHLLAPFLGKATLGTDEP